MISPDPIREPQAYQRYLLSLLGDDDPAEVQAATPAAFRGLVVEAGDRLYDRPEPDAWSAFGCLAHVADAELVMSARYRFILAHDEPPIIGYDQDLWVDRLHPDGGDPDELLALFETLRAANLSLWASTSAQDRTRIGRHAERGPESLDLSFRMIAGHDRFHLTQAREAPSAGAQR
jgi:DinB superfamily